MAIDSYLNWRQENIEAYQNQFNRNEYIFLSTLVLEKTAEKNPSSQKELLERYRQMILTNESENLKLDSSIISHRIRINTELFQLLEKRQILYSRINNILPELSKSVSYIHGHHLVYMRNLIRRGAIEQDYDAAENFTRDDETPVSELDIIAAAIEIQNSMLEIMEIFSRIQRGFSPKIINNDFNHSIKRFYKATNTFEDYSLDAQDGLLVEELLLNGATFEASFKDFLDLEVSIAREKDNLEWNREELLSNIATLKKSNENYLIQFKERLQLVKTISLFFMFIMLITLLYLSKKIISELQKVVKETSKIKKDHSYQISLEQNSFSEFTYIFNALNVMANEVSKEFEELGQSQTKLEELVLQRTDELTKINDQLKNEIEERAKHELQRRDLEERLNRAEKMEAIGTLAGGVAHDLNNILSGIVSYPELLLLNLPEDHKFRGPLETIKNSGHKAAVIVEDLLTMARRGVANHERVNLNQLIELFLKSPEFKNIRAHNSGVEIVCELDADIDTIYGSKVHLMKTLMNLLSNAAESISNVGIVKIITSNAYIDTVFQRYDQVNEGEYVKLSIQDNGTGIPPGNLEKVFEPFFSTKTMGRSGSGLGMAVVWGTIKDHNGYIDVISEVDNGSIFDVYLPLLRITDDVSSEDVNYDDLSANGESVLIVDDILEQREITTKMLEQLGYTVESVESGEKAIAFLKTRQADILVLDMIMQPGLDGLETYREITSFNPKQKAIVVSGFSESEKVLQAQNLGAGGYVKKPYTISEIAKALRRELETIR